MLLIPSNPIYICVCVCFLQVKSWNSFLGVQVHRAHDYINFNREYWDNETLSQSILHITDVSTLKDTTCNHQRQEHTLKLQSLLQIETLQNMDIYILKLDECSYILHYILKRGDLRQSTPQEKQKMWYVQNLLDVCTDVNFNW